MGKLRTWVRKLRPRHALVLVALVIIAGSAAGFVLLRDAGLEEPETRDAMGEWENGDVPEREETPIPDPEEDREEEDAEGEDPEDLEDEEAPEDEAKEGLKAASAEDGEGDGGQGDTDSGAGKSSGGSAAPESGGGESGGQGGDRPQTTAPTCSLAVRCDTLVGNLDLAENKRGLVPESGVIFSASAVPFTEGETVFDVLQRELQDAGIHMESSWTPGYDSAYIEGIGNLYEFDCGSLSGWMYKVNGWFPNYSCSQYVLADGDEIVWVYTCDLGADV